MQLAVLAAFVSRCCASPHRMQPYVPSLLTGLSATVLKVSNTFILMTCGLGGVASDAVAGYDAVGTVGGGRARMCCNDCKRMEKSRSGGLEAGWGRRARASFHVR